MRLVSRTVVGIVAGAAVAALAGSASLFAADDEDDAADAEAQRVAAEALTQAVARGKALWNDKTKFKKSCATCHEAADKPHLNLATRQFSYPAYSRKRRAVVTMHQKIQDMIQYSARGTPLDDKGTDIADLEAYVASLKRK